MDEFRRDCEVMAAWPYLREDDHVATASRAAHVVLTNEDLLNTMKTVYCDLPISPMLRMTCTMLVNLMNAEIHSRE